MDIRDPSCRHVDWPCCGCGVVEVLTGSEAVDVCDCGEPECRGECYDYERFDVFDDYGCYDDDDREAAYDELAAREAALEDHFLEARFEENSDL